MHKWVKLWALENLKNMFIIAMFNKQTNPETMRTIKIKSILANTLDSRDEAVKLFGMMEEMHPSSTDVALDFSGVEFMSRSFADQFHKEKLSWAKGNSQSAIVIENANTQIIEILKAVAQTQRGDRSSMLELNALSFSRPDQLEEYLLAI